MPNQKSLLGVFPLQGFPGGSDGKESTCNAGDLGSIPGLGRSPGEGNGSPLQYSCLENPVDRGAWRATVYGVPKSHTRLSDFHFHFPPAGAGEKTLREKTDAKQGHYLAGYGLSLVWEMLAGYL